MTAVKAPTLENHSTCRCTQKSVKSHLFLLKPEVER